MKDNTLENQLEIILILNKLQWQEVQISLKNNSNNKAS
jgi:hypothetical protein